MEDGLSILGRARRAYFKAAEGISTMSNHRCQMGCVVVSGHHIISSGCNSADKVHAFQARVDKKMFGCDCAGFLHAETAALLPLIKRRVDLSKAEIYIIRKRRGNGKLGMARPCPRCMSVIKDCGIKYVNYSTESGYAQEVIL